MSNFSKIALIYRPSHNAITTSRPYTGTVKNPKPKNMIGEVRIDLDENIIHVGDLIALIKENPEKARIIAHWADSKHPLPPFTHWERIR